MVIEIAMIEGRMSQISPKGRKGLRTRIQSHKKTVYRGGIGSFIAIPGARAPDKELWLARPMV